MVRHRARHLSIALLIAAGIALTAPLALPSTSSTAHAQSADAEKKAFEDAKALGTVEAWDAFLSHHQNGFYSDLARAYVKKLASPSNEAPAPSPPTQMAAPQYDYPMVAGTWGGIVRSGPGQDNARVASLKEGEDVTLMGPPIPVTPNDYPWFKIAFRSGTIGYMWGGILCSRGPERPDIYKQCTSFTESPASSNTREPASQPRSSSGSGPSWCANPSNGAEAAICRDPDLLSMDSVMNVAYRRAKSDSPNALGEIEKEQRHWLGRRNACGDDAGCVRKRYNEQIGYLESFFGN